MKIELLRRSMVVASATIPDTTIAPRAVVWGDRCFLRDPLSMGEPLKYKEVVAIALPPPRGMPRGTTGVVVDRWTEDLLKM